MTVTTKEGEQWYTDVYGDTLTVMPDSGCVLLHIRETDGSASVLLPERTAQLVGHQVLQAARPRAQFEALQACEVVLLADYMERPDVAGGFYRALAGAMRRADPVNLDLLYGAFTGPLFGYLTEQRAWAARTGEARA